MTKEITENQLKPRVLNKRTDTIPPNAVYVGRPSKWGNPYPINKTFNREDVIGMYRVWLSEKLKDHPDFLHELKGKDLVCWCSPLPCHADILLELANSEVINEIQK